MCIALSFQNICSLFYVFSNRAYLQVENLHVADPLIGHPSMNKGLWVLAGLLIFIVLEKVFTSVPGNMDIQKTTSDLNVKQENRYILNNNVKELVSGYANGHCDNVKKASSTHEKLSFITPVKSTSKKVHESILVCIVIIRSCYK
jgi:hypothetical protein